MTNKYDFNAYDTAVALNLTDRPSSTVSLSMPIIVLKKSGLSAPNTGTDLFCTAAFFCFSVKS